MLFLIDADTLDGVLLQLHNGESEPFRQEPYMICKACGHRWGALLPPALCLTNTERPYRPAKVVRVHREVGNSIMRLPIFGETRRPNRWRRHCTVKTSAHPPAPRGLGWCRHVPCATRRSSACRGACDGAGCTFVVVPTRRVSAPGAGDRLRREDGHQAKGAGRRASTGHQYGPKLTLVSPAVNASSLAVTSISAQEGHQFHAAVSAIKSTHGKSTTSCQKGETHSVRRFLTD